MKFYFDGVWGKMREDFLRKNKPEIYQRLKKSGKLQRYLEDYQKVYSERAEMLTKKLQLKYGVEEKNFEKDAMEWLSRSVKIFLFVREKLKSEIEK